MTDLDTPAGEAPRRAPPRGRARRHERSRAAASSGRGRQPRLRVRSRPSSLSADELESIHRASLRVLAEIGMDFLDADAREALAGGRRRDRAGSQRVRFDPDMVDGAHQDRRRRVHAPRLEPGAPTFSSAATGWRSGRSAPAQRVRPRPRAADRQPRRLSEPAAARTVAQQRPLPGRLPGRARRHPSRRPPPARHPRRADAHGQGDPLLFASGGSATSTCSRWSASRAASTTRRSTPSRRCSRSSTRARRCASTPRCSRASSPSPSATRSCASRRSR